MDTGNLSAEPINLPDDLPEPFNVEQHQIDEFRGGGKRDALWEFLERAEAEEKAKTSTVTNERNR